MDAPIIRFEDPSERRRRLARSWSERSIGKAVVAECTQNSHSDKNSMPVFDVEASRYEVLKFGIDNEIQKERRLNAKHQLLVQLGAKPPKKKYINYKVLQEEKQKQKEECVAQQIPNVGKVARLAQRTKSKRQIDVTSGYGKLRNGQLTVGKDVHRVMKRSATKRSMKDK